MCSKLAWQRLEAPRQASDLVSHKVLIKSVCKSQLQHKFVDLSFTITDVKNKLTVLWGSLLSKNNDKYIVSEKSDLLAPTPMAAILRRRSVSLVAFCLTMD